MLSIGKLVAGAEDYYLRTVADGAEEYYLGAGEAPGYWIGSGGGGFGLRGEVGSDELRSILSGHSPSTGEPLGLRGSAGNRVAGFDLTFSAPKSVSILWGLSSEEVANEVRASHDRAVADGIGYLERHAAFTRRGAGGTQRIGTSGFVGAAFRHRTSRTGDPQLHTHVLVANVVHGSDTRWSTLDARVTYHHARTAGFLYQAVLRSELGQRLGVTFGPVVNGVAEIEGVDRDLIRAFSTRRVAIEQKLAEWGTDSATAAQYAALETRPDKSDPAHERDGHDESLGDRWRGQAMSAGLDPGGLERVIGAPRHPELTEETVGGVVAQLLSPQGLTARAAAFERRDVVREVAAALGEGAPGIVIESVAERVMDSPEVVALGTVGVGAGERHTTLELLGVETRLRDTALSLTSSFRSAVSEETAAAVIASRPWLSAEQADMVKHTTTSGDGVEVVIGVAGAGKTTALDAAREIWNAEGHRVYGIALSARAAGELADGAGIEASTIATFERSLEFGTTRLHSGDVVIVDEAGMVGTRTLARVVEDASSAGAKVVLVGDDRQLPEIDAGGSFSMLAHHLGATRLVSNRRQVEVWERHALAELRHGNVAAAVHAFEEAGRIHEGGTALRTKELLVESWCDAHGEGHDARIYAARRRDVDELNGLARQELRRRGALGDDIAEVSGGIGFAHGDEVMCLRNDKSLDVVNGLRGSVLDARDGSIIVATDKGGRVIPSEYLDAGHLTHGYASTIHKSQGATVDRSFVYGTASLFRESGYVAMSRARERTDVYVVTGALETGIERSHANTTSTPELAEVLSVSRSKSTAESEMAGREADSRSEADCTHSVQPARYRSVPAYDQGRNGLEGTEVEFSRAIEHERARDRGRGR